MSEDDEVAERNARMKKLKLENDLLDLQLSARYQRRELFKAISTPAAVIVAALGIAISTSQWYVNARVARRVHADEQLQQRISLLAASSVPERIAAISSLKATLDGSDDGDAAQVISALTNELRAEGSPAVRDAVVSVISRMQQTPPLRIDRALSELLSANRDLTREGELYSLHLNDPASLLGDDSFAARAASTASAIVALLRAGGRAKDLSDGYFAREDFRNIELSGCSFERSTLTQAQFDGAKLSSANFDDAILVMTRFDGAQLENASFRQTPVWHGPKRRYNYVMEQIVYKLRDKIEIRGPSFKYAHLAGARFDDHFLFGLIANDTKGHYIENVSFDGADLRNVDLRNTWFFEIDSGNVDVMRLVRPYSQTIILIGTSLVSAAPITYDDSRIPDAFSRSGEHIGATFDGAKLTGTRLPPAIRHAVESFAAADAERRKRLFARPG